MNVEQAKAALRKLSSAQYRLLLDVGFMGCTYLDYYEIGPTWRALHKRGLICGQGLTDDGFMVVRQMPEADRPRRVFVEGTEYLLA